MIENRQFGSSFIAFHVEKPMKVFEVGYFRRLHYFRNKKVYRAFSRQANQLILHIPVLKIEQAAEGE